MKKTYSTPKAEVEYISDVIATSNRETEKVPYSSSEDSKSNGLFNV